MEALVPLNLSPGTVHQSHTVITQMMELEWKHVPRSVHFPPGLQEATEVGTDWGCQGQWKGEGGGVLPGWISGPSQLPVKMVSLHMVA